MHKRWFCTFMILSLILATAVPALANNYGVARNPKGGIYVNVYQSATYDAPVVTTVCAGAQVQIGHMEGDWYCVWANGTIGYIHCSNMSVGKEAPAPAPKKMAKVTTGPINLHATPSTGARVIMQLFSGEQVTVLSTGDIWAQVQVGDACGYVFISYLDIGGKRPTPVAPQPKPVMPQPNPPKAPIYTANANATVKTNNGGNLNLRAWPDGSASVLASFGYGTRVRILTHSGTWCKVQVGNQLGYMLTKYLAFDGDWTISGHKAFPTPVKGYGAVVKTPNAYSGLNLRKDPSADSKSLGLFYNGAQITVISAGKEWTRVQVNGVVGYMLTKYIHFTSKAPSYDKTVANNGSFVNLRSGAGYGYPILKKVASGAAATVVIPYPTWSKVIVKDGAGNIAGYMINSFLK